MVTIYAIECTENRKCYVGCTAGNIKKRMREHRCLLNSGKHSAKEMCRDWSTFGPDVFRIKTLEISRCSTVQEKREAELRWMRHYSARGLLYNAFEISFAGPPGSMRKAVEASMLPEACLKRAETRKRNRPAHCKYGHEFTDANTIINNKGARVCRACKLESSRRHERKKKAMI